MIHKRNPSENAASFTSLIDNFETQKIISWIKAGKRTYDHQITKIIETFPADEALAILKECLRKRQHFNDYKITKIIETFPEEESVAFLMELIKQKYHLGFCQPLIFETYEPKISQKIFVAYMKKDENNLLDYKVILSVMEKWSGNDIRELFLNANKQTLPYIMLTNKARSFVPELY